MASYSDGTLQSGSKYSTIDLVQFGRLRLSTLALLTKFRHE